MGICGQKTFKGRKWLGQESTGRQVWGKSKQLGNAGTKTAWKGAATLGWKVGGCPLLWALFTH